MSLLLDALKKAEKAKDDAKRRAQGGDSLPDPDETVIHVRTRDELPDISRPLEIHSEDIPAAGRTDSPVPDAFYAAPYQVSTASASPEPGPRHQQAEPSPVDRPEDPQASQRAAARNVFEAKFREPNPKLPFYITMAILGLLALGTVVYFWYQLRPPPALVNTDAKPPTDEKKIEVVVTRLPAQGQTALQEPVRSPAIPGLPSQASGPTLQSVPVPTATPVAVPVQATPMAPASASASQAQKPAVQPPAANRRTAGERAPSGGRAQTDPSKLSVSRAGPEINPKTEAAWAAYNQGDLQSARANYQDVLREEPASRDALLGMAAIEIRSSRPELAEAYYQKLLEANPRDPHAQAGLLALRTQIIDPVQAESRVKSLISSNPEANVLYFSLGNQYAQQGRWPEAQQAYFRAFSADPENPDFAYNLAVSLDHVKQPKLALEYYRRAIALAQQRSSSFDQALARNRAQELSH